MTQSVLSRVASSTEQVGLRSGWRIKWQLKAMLPVGAALLNGIILFIIATVSMGVPERHAILVVASVGALIVCAVLVVTLALVVRRPMLELEDKIYRVSNGDLFATVGFSERHDEIGDLGRNF